MTKKMLIDATHSEEMRVVIVDGTRLDELDIETSTKKQLKGNIYLAKVARVEPSLQAAFVDYGGNRHGFLAFNEIHPDYYQIPIADREALKEALMQEENEDEEEENKPKKNRRRRRAEKEENEEAQALNAEQDPSVQEEGENGEEAEQIVETVSENENDEVIARSRYNQIKHYKIQEVIHRGQVLLVQVIKEERGNKGAALTTYLSLAGRYCVLMPNNARGGGVSRKITNAADRKRLKSVVAKLPLPTGMSVIVRTAGKERTSLEIKRDYEYLIKTWVQIRDKTMESSAPALIHEEGNLIKRALRDMYTRDIAEVLIEGEAEYRMAKDFMKILTPSHAKKIKLYKDDTMPLFFRYQVETQLESLHSNIVQLKSGAYLVMDQTEALVAIDVNSGRATKERTIEETALKTNLEAADEIARQLRLRDMAGLVVIDFIDMEEARNNHAVERRMKEALKRDRARVQMGRITGFGLMELSRQRLHSSFIETSYSPCPYCKGKGVMRSTESVSIHTLHVLEEESLKRRFSELHMTVPTATALYVLNKKRTDLHKIETVYNVSIFLEADDSLLFPTDYRMERVVRVEPEAVIAPEVVEETGEPEEEQKETPAVHEKQPPRERRRRRNKRDQNRSAPEQRSDEKEALETMSQGVEEIIEEEVIQADEMFEEGLKTSQKTEEAADEHQDRNGEGRRKRRGRFMRRGRRFRHYHENDQHEEGGEASAEQAEIEQEPQQALPAPENGDKPVKKPRRRYNRRRRQTPAENTAEQ
ncbi:MAG: ribonuclease E/G [Alphaproteobacteria bacterium]|nr:ribonuclease E/G [Alphaproteobacteria bacterium]